MDLILKIVTVIVSFVICTNFYRPNYKNGLQEYSPPPPPPPPLFNTFGEKFAELMKILHMILMQLSSTLFLQNLSFEQIKTIF